jgi:hypothetical protein
MHQHGSLWKAFQDITQDMPQQELNTCVLDNNQTLVLLHLVQHTKLPKQNLGRNSTVPVSHAHKPRELQREKEAKMIVRFLVTPRAKRFRSARVDLLFWSLGEF